jgi:predicted O-methyltransferase YrrM
LRRYVTWLFTSREFTNYTYDLSERNLRHLAAFVSEVTGVDYAKAEGYVAELNRDAELRDHVRSTIASSSEGHLADRVVRFGRRLGWYAIVRAVKPRVVVETGIDKGLGSVVLTAALKRNAEEGHPGRYYGTDINPRAGYLLHGEYAKYGQCLYGDSLGSLIQLEAIVDVFINDSDHSADYEAREYEIIAPKLTPSAIVIGDNAHATDELLRFALRTGRRFLYFGEEPLDHWYPGAGIGAAFRRDG